MRAQHREFWRPSGPSAPPLGEAEALGEVVLLGNVTTFLRRQLSSPARVRGGLLFGYHDDERLHVLLASSAGVPGWYEEGRSRRVLEVDARFTLGWSEALFEVLGGRVDWVGNWLAHPDGQLRSEERDLRWFTRGVRLGLFDDRNILLVVGWEDSRFHSRAYFQGDAGKGEPLICLPSDQVFPERLRQIVGLP
ncbi:hypothetical protein [Deinococcus planocerae]|uniref:hypothetical protein n=1 Tax=Deinococcus planocerae TaxID=1737569 RepID=UPI0015E0E977|nr:hypothetical protein [Deinococcus planocerae]